MPAEIPLFTRSIVARWYTQCNGTLRKLSILRSPGSDARAVLQKNKLSFFVPFGGFAALYTIRQIGGSFCTRARGAFFGRKKRDTVVDRAHASVSVRKAIFRRIVIARERKVSGGEDVIRGKGYFLAL